MLIALAWTVCLAAAETYEVADPQLISARIVGLIDLAAPVLLDIQAGDLTSGLEFHIRQGLLERGADLREWPGQADAESAPEADSLPFPRLDVMALQAANLVQISLEIGSAALERKNFLSYSSERYPLYTFQIRQLALPARRLTRIDSLSFLDRSHEPESVRLSGLKWFEPVLASAVLASIVYLLWTTE